MVTQRYGQTDNQPKKASKTRTWRRYHSFPVATSPLAEGVSPAEQQITYSDYTATLQQYGAKSPITDVVQDTHEDPMLRVLSERSGEQAAKTVETVTIDVLKGGSNVYYANAAASRSAVNSPPLRADFRRVVRQFDRQNASPITRIIRPTPNVGTMGVEAGFFCMAHTDLEPDIRGITGFKGVVEYGNPGQATPGEVGSVERVRFVLTNMFDAWLAAGTAGTTYLANGSTPSTSTAADVYPMIVVARDAYGIVRLQGREAVKIMVLQPNEPRGNDELGQKGSVGWKLMYTCARLNEQWIARVEAACTGNPA